MVLSKATLRLTSRARLSQSAVRRYATTTSTHDEFDAVIVGGGPAGLALANALGSSPALASQRIILVEAGDLSKIRDWSLPADVYSNRVSSITNASSQFLQDTGAYSHLDHARTTPVQAMEVWDGVSDARISFAASDLGLSHQGMARMTENLNIQRALLRSLAHRPHVELADNVKVADIVRDDSAGESGVGGGWPIVHLSNGRSLRARLLIGADGLNSPVRKYAGIGTYGWAYDTHAIVATLRHAPRSPLQTGNTVAFQRFLPTGPIAFLPMSDTVSSLVWSTTPQLAAALKAVDPAVLSRMVNAAFRMPDLSMKYLHERILEANARGTPISPEMLSEELLFRERSHGIDITSAFSSMAPPVQSGVDGGVVAPLHADSLPPLVRAIQPGSIASFPLRYNHADTYTGPRSVLVGDAAHTIHPLAGQGLNMGLADVEALTRTLSAAVRTGGDIGAHTALIPYGRERYAKNHALMSAVDKLHRLYGTSVGNSAPVVWARSVGLEVVNELDTVKKAFMMSAGAKSRVQTNSGSPVWSAVAGGIQTANDLATGAKMVGGVLRSMVGAGLQEVGRRVGGGR